MTKRPGRNDTVDKAVLCLEVKGRWATLFETTPEAQRLLCQEIERAIPGIFKHLGDHEGYRENTEYHAMVWPVEVVRR